MKCDTLAIIGVGLLGGSVARSARQRGVARHIVGLDPDPSHRQRALDLKLVDEAGPGWTPEQAQRTEIVVACTPVDSIAAALIEASQHCRPGTLLTDVGSTKVDIVREVESRLSGEHLFVGSHPMAGSEKRGPEHADGWLFEGRLVLVTPTPRTPSLAVERATGFWQALGARVRCLSPEAHDQGVALTSHLPHLVASALAGVLPKSLGELAASGFRDTTRLASGDAGLWTAICTHNREYLLDALARFSGRLEEFRTALEANDPERLRSLFEEGKQARQATF